MGTEYKISAEASIDDYFDIQSLVKLKSFWKFDQNYKLYYLGQIGISEWPAVMVWKKNGSVGITVNDESSPAWIELRTLITRLCQDHPDILLSDWDTGEDASEDVLND